MNNEKESTLTAPLTPLTIEVNGVEVNDWSVTLHWSDGKKTTERFPLRAAAERYAHNQRLLYKAVKDRHDQLLKEAKNFKPVSYVLKV